jgi:hypothetical protein
VCNLQIWSHYLLFSSAGPDSHGGHTPNQVTVIDLTTKRVKVVARSYYPQGQSDIAAGVGNYIAWTDQPTMQTDDGQTVSWKLHLTDIRTGRDQVIAASHGAERIVPVPAASDGHVVWTQLMKNQRAGEIHSYDITTGRNRTLVSGIGPSSTTVSGGYVVYDTATRQGADIFEVSTDGGKPRRLTTSGKTALPRAQANRVVWQEPNQGDPTSLWTEPLGGHGRPVRAVSQTTAGNAVAGSRFIAYWSSPDSGEHLTVTFLRADGTPGATQQVSDLETAVPPRIASDATRIAWGEYLSGGAETKPDGPQIIRIQLAAIG